MALVQLLLGRQKSKGFASRQKDGSESFILELDVTINETGEFTSKVSESEVEDGSNIADHVTLDPDKLTIQGFISATPGDTLKVLKGASFGDPVNDAFLKLDNLRKSKQPFDFVAGLKTYKDMVMTSLSIPRDQQTGRALRFSAVMQQVVIVSSTTVSPLKLGDGKKKLAAPKTNIGVQEKTKVLSGDSFQSISPTKTSALTTDETYTNSLVKLYGK